MFIAESAGKNLRSADLLKELPNFVRMIEDTNGDLVGINYYCSAQCYTLSTGTEAYGHAWPGGSETDYDVMCHHCGTLLWRGLSS